MKRIRRMKFSEQRHSCLCRTTPGSHSGATLTEVLMSILVMGVGVLSVITLFPASFLRTLQATNITHSTILRYNADALIDIDRTNRATVYPYWQPGTAYVAGDIVLANIASGGDNRRYVCTTAGTSDNPGPPVWDTTVGNTTTEAGGVQWLCEDHSRYVIDPLGWNFVPPAMRDDYGNDGVNPFVPAAPFGRLQRFNAGATSIGLTDSLVTLPDSWTFQVQGLPTNLNVARTAIDLNGVDLTQISHYDPTILGVTPVPPSHVVLTDATGRFSHTRWINSIAGQTLNWTDPLPATFVPFQARIETQERRYTWMLTVRRSSAGIPAVEVAVLFRRNVTADDERVFTATTNGREVTINHTPGPNSRAPFAKKGGFIFDVENARWYRIQDSIAWTATQTRVTLDRAPIEVVNNVVVPRGVVDVFPIESKP